MCMCVMRVNEWMYVIVCVCVCDGPLSIHRNPVVAAGCLLLPTKYYNEYDNAVRVVEGLQEKSIEIPLPLFVSSNFSLLAVGWCVCVSRYIFFFGGISHQKHFRLLRGNFIIIVVYRYHLRLRFLAWPMSVPHRCRCATEPSGFRCIHAPDAGSRQLHTTHKQRPRERHTNTRRRLWKYTFLPNRHERTHKWRSIFFPSGTKYCRTLYTFPA